MITEDYISFETAKLLKEKGFDEYCYGYYYEPNHLSHSTFEITNSELESESYSAPTQAVAMKWLREVHKLWITITFHWHTVDGETTLYYSPYIMLSKYKNIVLEDKNPFKMKLLSTYEQACEAAIKYCLENLI